MIWKKKGKNRKEREDKNKEEGKRGTMKRKVKNRKEWEDKKRRGEKRNKVKIK